MKTNCSKLLSCLAFLCAVGVAAEITRVPGLRGQGAMIGGKHESPTFAVPPDISIRQGTVEFWFTPHDWDNRMLYQVHGRNYSVPLLRAALQTPGSDEAGNLFTLSIYRMSETKAFAEDGIWVRHPVYPGSWHHVLIVWEDRAFRVLVNGQEADDWVFRLATNRTISLDSHLTRLEFLTSPWMTTIDEFRYYPRALTPLEIENAYARYLPDRELQPLPFSDASVSMNNHSGQIVAATELLGPERDDVAAVHLKLTDQGGVVLVDAPMSAIENGRAELRQKHEGTLYGSYAALFTFTAADGTTIATQTVNVERPAPAWFGNTLGMHEGKVLPEWEPMRREGNLIRLLDKEIEFDGSGWPSRLAAKGEDVLTEAPRITLVSDAGPIELTAAGTAPEVLTEREDLIITRGAMRGAGWELTTTINSEFDGFMHVEATLAGPADAILTELRIEFPLQLAPEQFVGFWAGNPWFRGACDYHRLPMPQSEGIEDGLVFRSNNHRRSQPDGWQKRVSFLPFVSIADDWRGFFWLAENDRHWSQSWTTPAQEIVRIGDRTILRLNLVHPEQPRSMGEARTYVFAFQTMPVRPLAPDARERAKVANFGQVDGFNGHTITSEFGGHTAFRLAPEGLDWSIVERKVPAARRVANGMLHMYLDRIWNRAPEDAIEYNRDWRGWGDATRYTPEVRDCYAYYINEYLRRGLVDGFYIDDCWTKPTMSHYPAYRRDDGEREWGFEFFDYRKMLMRMRWLFHDNEVKPRIWAHVTQTLYYPVFSFVDLFVDGEDRFPPWGVERNFITSWGVDRIRYSNSAKSGIPTVFMNAIGNKLEARGPMPKWAFRQKRAYVGLCAATDVWSLDDSSGDARRDFIALGCADDQAHFVGYWEAEQALVPDDPRILVSVYRLPDHLAVVILNSGPKESVPRLTVNAALIQEWLGDGRIRIENADSLSMPEEDDIQDYIAEAKTLVPADEANVLARVSDTVVLDAFAALEESVAEEERQANDPLARYGEHSLGFDEGVLQLRIRGHDYRLLKLTVEEP